MTTQAPSDYGVPVSQQILKKLAKTNLNEYNYNQPGSLTMAYRVPTNLVGQSLRNANKEQVRINNELLNEKQAAFNQTIPPKPLMKNSNTFPKTTNQDFFTKQVWEASLMAHQAQPATKFNYKKVSEFSSYVDAVFNKGVYQKPTYDML